MTTTVKPTVFDTDDELGAALGAQIADLLEEANAAGRHFVLGCPGGRTPRSTYAHLAKNIAQRAIELDGLIIAMMDDYVIADGQGWAHVPADAHYSCRRFGREEIQGVLNDAARGSRIADENVWFPDPADPVAYDERLIEAGGIDFFILASGAGDGHVAFNPPGSERESRTRVVELALQTRVDNMHTFPGYRTLDDVPTHGVTVGIDTIASLSRRAVMVAHGEAKRDAVVRLSSAGGYDPEWPATVWQEVAHTALYVDSAAAGGGARGVV